MKRKKPKKTEGTVLFVPKRWLVHSPMIPKIFKNIQKYLGTGEKYFGNTLLGDVAYGNYPYTQIAPTENMIR